MNQKMLKALGSLTGYDLSSPQGLGTALKDLIKNFEPGIVAWKKKVEQTMLQDGELYVSFQVLSQGADEVGGQPQLIVAIVAIKEEEGSGRPVFSRRLFPLLKYTDFVFGAFTTDPRFSPEKKPEIAPLPEPEQKEIISPEQTTTDDKEKD